MRLADCTWIRKGKSVLFTGPTGVGKSYLACALGHRACVLGFKTFYFNAAKLFAMLKLTKADGSYLKMLLRIQKQDLVIIDDFGLERLDKDNRLSLMDIMEDRHGLRSTIITAQLPANKWHDIIGDATIADAVIDRLIHSALRFELDGPTLRKKYEEDLT